MFLLDSLMISGIRWVMNTVVTAAEAEMNDDTALREQLLDAEMRREMGEISDEEFAGDRGRSAGAHPRDQGAARGGLRPAVDGRRSRSRPPPTARSRSKRASPAISTSPPTRRTPRSSRPSRAAANRSPSSTWNRARRNAGIRLRAFRSPSGTNATAAPNGPNGPNATNDPNETNDPERS